MEVLQQIKAQSILSKLGLTETKNTHLLNVSLSTLQGTHAECSFSTSCVATLDYLSSVSCLRGVKCPNVSTTL